MKLYTVTNKLGKFYYSDKARTILHRKNGPAIEYKDSEAKEWYLKGSFQRWNREALEFNEAKQYWLNGVRYYNIRNNSEWRAFVKGFFAGRNSICSNYI